VTRDAGKLLRICNALVVVVVVVVVVVLVVLLLGECKILKQRVFPSVRKTQKHSRDVFWIVNSVMARVMNEAPPRAMSIVLVVSAVCTASRSHSSSELQPSANRCQQYTVKHYTKIDAMTQSRPLPCFWNIDWKVYKNRTRMTCDIKPFQVYPGQNWLDRLG